MSAGWINQTKCVAPQAFLHSCVRCGQRGKEHREVRRVWLSRLMHFMVMCIDVSLYLMYCCARVDTAVTDGYGGKHSQQAATLGGLVDLACTRHKYNPLRKRCGPRVNQPTNWEVFKHPKWLTGAFLYVPNDHKTHTGQDSRPNAVRTKRARILQKPLRAPTSVRGVLTAQRAQSLIP